MATSSPITGVPLPVAGGTDQVPTDLMTAFSNAEKKFVMPFASAADRDTKITAPTAGMVAFLTSPGKLVYYDGNLSAWEDLLDPNAWSTWTPTLQSSGGTAFTLGAGSTQIGRCRQIGKTVTFQATWNFGTSGVGGPGGALKFALPSGLAGANVAGLQQTGPCTLWVPSLGESFLGFWTLNPGGTTAQPWFPKDRVTSSMGNLQNTSDGSTASTGIPNISNTSQNFPLQPNGTLTASGSYQIA